MTNMQSTSLPKWRRLIVTSVAVAGLGLSATSIPIPARLTDCSGCDGLGGSQTTTSGNNMVSVVVAVTDGLCTGTAPNCVGYACEVTITRTWDLPIGIQMDFCTIRPPPQQPLCVAPPPVVQVPGSGSDITTDYIRCGGWKTYTLTTSSLSAQATGSCGACD